MDSVKFNFPLSLRVLNLLKINNAVALFLVAIILFARISNAADLKVMRMGLGSGTVTSSPAGINCGATCDAPFANNETVTLTAAPDAGSTFLGWDQDADADASSTSDCQGTAATCTLPMSVARSVRPVFDLSPAIPVLSIFTPEGIAAYLSANPAVNTPARFIKALPDKFKQNWILMSRSESLQTGIAQYPRILLPSADAKSVFSIGMAEHGSYPGAHPNAIEYMQWDAGEKNFRFHEIVLDNISAMGNLPPRNRGISMDDEKCSKCHSTRNVPNINRTVSPPVPNPASNPGTDGVPPGTVKAKNKPNWDTYDSWGGMSPFNRDRIYQGSLEAAALRKILNPWTWRTNEPVRSIIEQLKLQPPGVQAADMITRLRGGANDGLIKFAFDASPPVLTEPPPSGTEPPITTSYAFDGVAGTGPATSVTRGGTFITLQNPDTPVSSEGRGVQLFDLLGGLDGNLNPQRIADELTNHRFATGSVPIDVRPVALAVANGCISLNSSNAITTPSPLTVDLGFFNARNGMGTNDLVLDTRNRAQSLPRRKADIQKINLDRNGDPYLFSSATANGLIQQYGPATSAGTDSSLSRLRQEIFRRPIDLGRKDATVMGGIYVDRELYGTQPIDPSIEPFTDTIINTNKIALFRYFLEPLGVSVDKWSMGVRGRSRSYTFADVFGSYENVLISELRTSLINNPLPGLSDPNNCGQLIGAVNNTLSSLPPVDAVPTYTDVQRVFNKGCIECHGGLGYPPYYASGSFDLSEDEKPPTGTPPMVSPRLARSYDNAVSLTTTNPATSYIYQRITNNGTLPHPYNPTAIGTDERCPGGIMPCGGPPLSKSDIETVRRWIAGPPSRPSTAGDPHIKTVDGTDYDFQSAGEFVLLRDEGMEIQARQTPVATESPLGPNAHTGLSSCVSINTAAAIRIGPHRITYQPNSNKTANPKGLQLRIDGKLTELGGQEIPVAMDGRFENLSSTRTKFIQNLPKGGRIMETTAPSGIQVETPGGTVVTITPGWWDYYQLWYLNIDVHHAKATQGVMGVIPPGSWLPSLPDGIVMGPRPTDIHQRYVDLYEKFENAWRVTDASTLFDYAPGTSTNTFTIANWPTENPQSCPLPEFPEGPQNKPPLKPLPIEAARQLCQGITAADRRANCEQDVMVTAEPKFAETYAFTEKIVRNKPPAIPKLVFPEDNKEGPGTTVSFSWENASDIDGDPVTHRHCIWPINEKPTFNCCGMVPSQSLPPEGGKPYSQALICLIFLLFMALIYLCLNKKGNVLVLTAIAILIVLTAVYYFKHSGSTIPQGTLHKTVSGLKPGDTYYWKVIAEDNNGGSTESETRRFIVK